MSDIGMASARGWTLLLLFLASVLNLLDRQIINILAQAIKTDLHISDAQLGLLTGTAFGVLYALAGVPLGRLADRTDRARMIGIALVVWSAFTAVSGLAGNFLQLFAARVGVGLGEASVQPASTALVCALFPAERRASAMSALLLGAPVGGFLGLLLGGYAGSTWGWRTAFLAAGAPGVVLGVLVLALMRDPGLERRRTQSAPLAPALAAILADARLRRLTLGLICSTFLVYASGAWLPVFFIRAHAMTAGEIGPIAALAVGLGGGFGTLGGGVACDLLRSRVQQVEIKLLAGCLLAAIPALLITVLSPETDLALWSMGVFDVLAYAYLGPVVVLIQQQSGAETRALVIALCVAVANISALGVGLPLVGVLSDLLTPTAGAGGLGQALAVAIAPTALFGAVAFVSAGRRPPAPG